MSERLKIAGIVITFLFVAAFYLWFPELFRYIHSH